MISQTYTPAANTQYTTGLTQHNRESYADFLQNTHLILELKLRQSNTDNIQFSNK
jgi:hypothetical protein